MSHHDDSNSHQPQLNADPQHSIELAKKAGDLLQLAEKDRRAAELAFEQLGFDAQLETALALQGDELHEWLMLSEDLTELVRALPPEHLHTAVRLIGEEDALNLLQAASSEQMQQMTDIEWFTEGKLDQKKVRRWLELLLELDEDECDQAMQGIDLNALGQFLRRKVRPAVDKDNLLLALHLNQRYLFTPEDLTTNDDLVRRFLDFLYNVDRDLFGEVLGLIVGEDAEIVENDMYAGREDRLIKRGFPAMAYAEHLLELVNASAYGIEWPSPAANAETPAAESVELAARPAAADTPFLLHAMAWGRASAQIGERTERQFIKESAELANSLLLAHTKDTGNPERRPESLLAVQVLASIALESLSMSTLSAAPNAVSMKLAVDRLKSLELRELFQLGWSLTREVAKDAWILAMDDRISDAGLERNLKWLPDALRNAVLEAEDYMSWRRIAASASGGEDAKLLTWPRLVELRWAVDRARNAQAGKSG